MPPRFKFEDGIGPKDERGCTPWVKKLSTQGYGEYSETPCGKRRRAHVIAWEMRFGPVPEGLELDHLCRNRACVNTDHLEPVSHQVNVQRGWWGLRQTCTNGHPLDGVTNYRARGGRPARSVRYCKTCNRINVKRYAKSGGYSNRRRIWINGIRMEAKHARSSQL